MKGTAFITGATSGFGRACAELFAQDGWNLVLAARRTDRLADVKERLEGDIAIHTITLDVRDRQAVKAAVADLPAQFSDVNILLNNAGLALGLAPAHKVDLDDWETMVDTNIKGMMYCTHAVLPAMVERNRGHIFNIGSVAGDWPYPNAQCLLCHQGIRETVFTDPPYRSGGNSCPGDQYRTGPGGNGVLTRALQGGSRYRRQRLRQHPTAHGERYRGYHFLGSRSAAPRQYQSDRGHAGMPGSWADGD